MPWTDGDVALHFLHEGSGPPLLLLHELGGSLVSWEAVVARLLPKFRIIRFDQRGFGSSEKPRTPYIHGDLVDDVERVLGAAVVNEAITIVAVAGASAIAVAFAHRFPRQVRALVLCSPSLGVDSAGLHQARQRADRVSVQGMRSIVDVAMERVYPASVRGETFADYRGRFLANDPVGFAMANYAFAEATVTLSGLGMPILLLAGTLDVRPVGAIRELASGHPNVHVAVVKGAGHIMPMHCPDRVAFEVELFLDSAERSLSPMS